MNVSLLVSQTEKFRGNVGSNPRFYILLLVLSSCAITYNSMNWDEVEKQGLIISLVGKSVIQDAA